MTIQDVVAAQVSTNTTQLAAYQADIANLLTLIGTLTEQQGVLQAWLAANPAAA